MGPPFRAEHIGSLLRPAVLLESRRRYACPEITRAQLQAAESQAMAQCIATAGPNRRDSCKTSDSACDSR